jgi:hypothetical protein
MLDLHAIEMLVALHRERVEQARKEEQLLRLARLDRNRPSLFQTLHAKCLSLWSAVHRRIVSLSFQSERIRDSAFASKRMKDVGENML